MKRRNWTREELILAYNGYCKIPYGKFNTHSAEVKELAEIIGRSPGAIAFKLVNFVSLDPKQRALGRSGASNVSKLDRLIFEEFQDDFDKMYLESEVLLVLSIQQKTENDDKLTTHPHKKGETVERTVKTRKNQDYFRNMVLVNYANECAITGIKIPSLLIASHIKPWSVDEKNRLNPQNGLCLSATFDKAFDRGLITLTEDYEVLFSEQLKGYSNEVFYNDIFLPFKEKQIRLPKKFLPHKSFIQYHNNEVFKG